MTIERIDTRKCRGCGMCVLSCPMDVIRLDRGAKKAFIAYPDDCMVCGLCKIHCPHKAIKYKCTRSEVILAWS